MWDANLCGAYKQRAGLPGPLWRLTPLFPVAGHGTKAKAPEALFLKFVSVVRWVIVKCHRFSFNNVLLLLLFF